MEKITEIPGAEVALRFLKLKSSLPGDNEWFTSDFPYTYYRERKWDAALGNVEIEPRFTTSMNCSDFFYWGTADSEEVTDENFHVLEESVADLMKFWQPLQDKENASIAKFHSNEIEINEVEWQYDAKEKIASQAEVLFCARVRNMRPQGACYKSIPEELHFLFNAVGETRPIDLFNPKTEDDVYEYGKEANK